MWPGSSITELVVFLIGAAAPIWVTLIVGCIAGGLTRFLPGSGGFWLGGWDRLVCWAWQFCHDDFDCPGVLLGQRRLGQYFRSLARGHSLRFRKCLSYLLVAELRRQT